MQWLYVSFDVTYQVHIKYLSDLISTLYLKCMLDKSLSWYLSIDLCFCCELLPYIDLCVMITRVSCIWSSVILYILNLLGGCKYKIYYMQLSYCKFCIYTHPVISKFTIWQQAGSLGGVNSLTALFVISNVK